METVLPSRYVRAQRMLFGQILQQLVPTTCLPIRIACGKAASRFSLGSKGERGMEPAQNSDQMLLSDMGIALSGGY